MHKVIPGILEKEASEIEKRLNIIKPFSRFVHVDFIDGKFSPELSFLDFAFFQKYTNDFFMEAHLMVENPQDYIKPLANVGFKRFLGHIEKMNNLEEFIALGQVYGEVCLAYDIDTTIDALKIPFDNIDSVLLMSVKAGKSGQVFAEEVLEKISKIREVSQISIEIDGGINDKTIVLAKQAGASRFVATSFIFSSPDPVQSYERLVSLA